MASTTQNKSGDLMITAQPTIALIDQFGEDEAAKSMDDTQYNMQVVTLPEGVPVLITFISPKSHTMIQVMYKNIYYWVDSSMLRQPSEG